MKQHWRSNSSFINFVRHIRQLLWAPSWLHSFVLCLVGDCGKIVIFAIFAKCAAFANFYGPPSLLCVLPRWRLWQNCHFRHICQIRRFRQLLWAPFTALCFALLAIVAKLSFSPYLPNSPFSPTFMGPLYYFVLCLVGNCGKIVIFAIFAKFAAFANVYGPPSLLCALPRWRLWQNCHFRLICQIRCFRQLLWAPFTALCFASLAIVAKLSFSPNFMGPLYCFVLCLLGDCGKIVIFAIFAKFAAFANFYGAPSLLCSLPRWRLWQNCHFRHICQMRRFRQLLWAPFTALCFASLAIVAKLSFSPYLPNSPLSPTFMGPLHCFVFCLVGDCGKIVIFAIFAKFAVFANFYGAPILFCALPRWQLWQNCHFCHICQIRRFRQRLWAPFTALCFASLAIVAKLSFSPYLPNSLLSPTFMGPLHCFVLCLVGDCSKIVIFAKFYGAPILLCALPPWRLWQNCHFRHICQVRRFRQLLWGSFTALCFASLAIVAKLSFSPYLPNSPLSPTFMGPLHCFVLCLVGDCGKSVIFANFYGAPSLLCVLPRWRLWQNCHFRHICQIRRFRQLLWGPYTALCFASLAIVAKLSFSPYLPNSPLSPTFMGPLYCFVLCLFGDCGKIVIFAIFAKFAAFANVYGAPILLCALPRWQLWQNCHFRHICQIRRFRQLLWGPYTALCLASLAIVAKLSFSPYLPNSPLLPTFMGPLHCFVFCLVGDCGKIVIFAIFAKFATFTNFYGAPILLCALPLWRLWQNCHFCHICQIRRFRQRLWAPFTALCFASLAIVAKLSFSPYLPNSLLSPTFMGPLHCFVLCLVGDCSKIVIFANFYGAPILLCSLPPWRLWQNCHFRHICQVRRFRQLLWGSFTALCFSSLAIVAKLSFSPYLPNSPLSPTFMGPLHCFVLCLVGDCGKIVIFANFYGAPSLLCVLPRWRLWQNCHFRHICQIRRFRQLLWGPYTALCFASLAIVAKLSFSPYLPNSPLSPTFMGPLYCFVLCLVGDCGKIVIFAIFAKFAAFANVYGAPILLCALPRWQLWQNCHFRHICQIRRFRQLLWGPYTALCFASLAIVAKLSFSPYLPNSPLSPTFMGPLYSFVLCLFGDCGKIVIFAIFAKFAAFANVYGAPILLCAVPRWQLWQNCHFRHICQIRRFRQLLWGPYTALCFASLAIVAKLSFSPYLTNSPLSPTFMGPLYCFVLCLVGNCGKIVFFAIFAKFAAFANFYGAPILLCALPRWRLWQNCHFRHICQIRRFCQLLWGPFTALCFASLAIVAKLSFSPYLPNPPFLPTFMGSLHCFLFFLVGDCGEIVIFAIFAKFAAFANFYGAPSLLCVLPRWRLWQNCHFRHICQIRRFCQLLWAPFTAFSFSSLAIVAKLSFSPYLPNSPLLPTFMGPLHCFVFCLVGDCGKIVIFAIFAKSAVFANFYGLPSLLSLFPRWRLWRNCHFRHICQIRRFCQLLWGPFTALCFASLAIVAKLSFSPYLPNSPFLPTFMGPLYCFLFFLVGDCGKIVIFAIFANFANIISFLQFLLLCAFLDISPCRGRGGESLFPLKTVLSSLVCPNFGKYTTTKKSFYLET